MDNLTNLDEALKTAVSLGASDIHLAVGSKPRCRIYGTLESMDYKSLTHKYAENLLNPLMDAYARSLLNEQGSYDMAYQIQGVARFRVNIFKQKGDLAAVFRVLNQNVPDYTKLGLPLSVFNLYKKRRGLILVVGVTGSGKSTTLASFIDLINKNMYKHIITLEDPIEYIHWHERCIINQREVGTDCASFHIGLRAALREDPDVILVGEMRDMESVDIALQAAETGHLVCSTLHTMGAVETVNRVIDMFPEKQHKQVRSTLSEVLEAVVAQQLIPRMDGSGYVVAYEILFKNRYIRDCIREDRINELYDYMRTDEAKNEGMCVMDDTILDLYKKRLIMRDSALDYAFDRREMAKRV